MNHVDWWSWKCLRCGWEAKRAFTVNAQQAVGAAVVRVHIDSHAEVANVDSIRTDGSRAPRQSQIESASEGDSRNRSERESGPFVQGEAQGPPPGLSSSRNSQMTSANLPITNAVDPAAERHPNVLRETDILRNHVAGLREALRCAPEFFPSVIANHACALETVIVQLEASAPDKESQ